MGRAECIQAASQNRERRRFCFIKSSSTVVDMTMRSPYDRQRPLSAAAAAYLYIISSSLAQQQVRAHTDTHTHSIYSLMEYIYTQQKHRTQASSRISIIPSIRRRGVLPSIRNTVLQYDYVTHTHTHTVCVCICIHPLCPLSLVQGRAILISKQDHNVAIYRYRYINYF